MVIPSVSGLVNANGIERDEQASGGIRGADSDPRPTVIQSWEGVGAPDGDTLGAQGRMHPGPDPSEDEGRCGRDELDPATPQAIREHLPPATDLDRATAGLDDGCGLAAGNRRGDR